MSCPLALTVADLALSADGQTFDCTFCQKTGQQLDAANNQIQSNVRSRSRKSTRMGCLTGGPSDQDLQNTKTQIMKHLVQARVRLRFLPPGV